MSEINIPDGYEYEVAPSAFPNHVGPIFRKAAGANDDGSEKHLAFRVEEHHVNSWGFAHGGLIAFLGEVATASVSWVPGGPPVVGIELNTHFIGAPKLGQLIEIKAVATKRTRSLVFSRAEAFAEGELLFTASGINKILKG